MSKPSTEKYLRKCPVCGRFFWCTNVDMWAYKMGMRDRQTNKIKLDKPHLIFCSYHCMRAKEGKSEV